MGFTMGGFTSFSQACCCDSSITKHGTKHSTNHVDELMTMSIRRGSVNA